MFESGIGPGIRSDRFGTWSLITFLALFVTPFVGGLPLVWLPLLACAAASLAAIAYGLVGVFIPEQRRAALQGLLKAAVPTVVGGFFTLVFLAFSYANFE
jgi:ABC-type phosphate transport system permease subunit